MAERAANQSSLIEVDYEFRSDEGPSSAFRVVRLRFVEQVHGCYELELDLATEDLNSDIDAFLGASCQLDISRGDVLQPVFGIVAALELVGYSEDQLLVHLRIVPAFALLAQQTHSRIFQEMTVQEILSEVLSTELAPYNRTFDAGNEARGKTVRDYCVQYRESDFDFCVRLMEDEGISYAFVHSDDAGHEVLTLRYSNGDYATMTGLDAATTLPIITDRPHLADVESIQRFGVRKTLTTTSVLRRDYDFETPLELLEVTKAGQDDKGRTRRVYRHTDRRFISDDVTERAADHLEASGAHAQVARGSSNATSLRAGCVFELDRHARDDFETQYLVTKVVHTGECGEVLLGGDTLGRGGPRYANTFQCVPLAVPLRPRQLTPKPRVYGAETGIVAGPSGEEIHVDEHGRIKVQFHWEEEATYDDTSSCWVRVRQSWSGPGWGFQFIPRVGQEVVVEFLGGDPDRPLVTGTVFNGEHSYPYPLPAEKTRSGIKTDSVSGDGSNELRFEDSAGAEEVYIHCQKDFTIATENDKNQTTGHDETLEVGNDRTKTVGHDQSETVKNDKTITVEGNHSEHIKKDMTLTIDGARSEAVKQDHTESIEGAYEQAITKTKTVKVKKAFTESVDDDKSVTIKGKYSTKVNSATSLQTALTTTVKSGKDMTLSSDKTINLKAGADIQAKAGALFNLMAGGNLTVKTDKAASVTATDELSLKVGSASITISKSGDITIRGVNIDIEGSGAVAIKGASVDNN